MARNTKDGAPKGVQKEEVPESQTEVLESADTSEGEAREEAVHKVEKAVGEPLTGDPLGHGTPLDVGALATARATVDTSGLAGPADHDIRRGTAAFDALTLATRDELPEHLEKYVNSPSGLVGITERAAEERAHTKGEKSK